MENLSGSGDDMLGHRIATSSANRGFTYLGVLLAIGLLSVGLSIVSEVWWKTAEHQKLEQLDWAGQQYVHAIESYYYANTGSVRFYPPTLNDLLEDKRYFSIKRHIRQLYPNPFTGKQDWMLISGAGGGIQGIRLTIRSEEARIERQYVFLPRLDND